LRRNAVLFQYVCGRPATERKRQQHGFDGDELVAGLLRQLLRLIEQAGRLRRQIELPGPAAFDFRQFCKLPLDALIDRGRRSAGRVDQVRSEPILVVEQRFEHVQWRDLLMATA
jgi:hypothetical protein